MSDLRYVTEIRVPPACVWSALLDIEHWPEWNSAVTRIHRMDLGPLSLGSRTRIWQPHRLPAIFKPTVWCVTSLDEQRRIFTWATHSTGLQVSASHHVEAVDGHTRLTLTLHFSGLLGPLMARLLRKTNWDFMTREATGLRNRCEAGAAQPAETKVTVQSL